MLPESEALSSNRVSFSRHKPDTESERNMQLIAE